MQQHPNPTHPNMTRKASDDVSLRPFSSIHFDAQAYVRGVLSDRRSEEALVEVDRHIQGINEEINRYITHHKRDLMGGMQDVSVLAHKYSTLQQSSETLRYMASKLKQEAHESLSAVQSKTDELTRMHETAVVVRQLRQFVHIKGQLDHQLKRTPGDNNKINASTQQQEYDIRQLAGVSRLLRELEVLMALPSLRGILCVAEARPDIEDFGRYLRHTAQGVLMNSLREQNHASLSSSLQVFALLDSLPDIVIYAVDNTVKLVADLIREVVDVQALAAQYPAELSSGGNKANKAKPLQQHSMSYASVTAAATAGGGGKKELPGQQQGATGQLRLSLREIAHQFENIVYEYTMHVNTLQQLVAHTEDPASHVMYSHILLAASNSSAASNPFVKHGGNIVLVFWERLSAALHDVFYEKVKTQPVASVRLYPCLRKAAVDVVDSFKLIFARDASSQMFSGASDSAIKSASVGGDIFGCHLVAVGTNALGFGHYRPLQAAASSKGDRENSASAATAALAADNAKSQRVSVSGPGSGSLGDVGLVAGLGPCRDRYLLETTARMTAPIALMFPELEGFTSAVPSKRDLSALLQAMKTELVALVVEGELTLLRQLCREVVKVVQLLLTKVEGLISTSVEVAKIAVQSSSSGGGGGGGGSCVRNAQQEHNAHIVVLVHAMSEAMAGLPVDVLKQAQDATGSKLTRSAAANEAFKLECLEELQRGAADASIALLETQLASSLLLPLANAIANYVDDSLVGLVTHESAGGSTEQPRSRQPQQAQQQQGSAGHVDLRLCSRTLRALDATLPLVLRTHLLSLPTSALLTSALEEVCLRLVASFVSVCALVRPVTDTARARTLADITLVEHLVCGACPSLASVFSEETPSNPVVSELHSLRSLLSSGLLLPPIPSPKHAALLKSSQFAGVLRPSTLVTHLISLAPPQLPSPAEIGGSTSGSTPHAYLRMLSSFSGVVARDAGKSASPFGSESVLSLYARNFGSLPQQASYWALVAQCLDLFMQRAAVAETAAQRESMRQWYELIVDVGGSYFQSTHQYRQGSNTARLDGVKILILQDHSSVG